MIALAGAVVIPVVLVLVVPSLRTNSPGAVALLAAAVLPWLALGGWPWLATARRGNGPVIDLGLRMSWGDVGRGALGGMVAWVLLALIATVTMALTGDFTSAAGEAAGQMSADGNQLSVVAFAIAIALGAPLVEEVAFRGLMFDALRKRGVNEAWTIVVTAAVFACFHFEPVRLPLLMAMGLVLGFLRSRTRALGAPMVAHLLVNAPGAILVAQGLPGIAS